jgi:hypothetical protein
MTTQVGHRPLAGAGRAATLFGTRDQRGLCAWQIVVKPDGRASRCTYLRHLGLDLTVQTPAPLTAPLKTIRAVDVSMELGSRFGLAALRTPLLQRRGRRT